MRKHIDTICGGILGLLLSVIGYPATTLEFWAVFVVFGIVAFVS